MNNKSPLSLQFPKWSLSFFLVVLFSAHVRANSYDDYFQRKKKWHDAISKIGLSEEERGKKIEQSSAELLPLLENIVVKPTLRVPVPEKSMQPTVLGVGEIGAECVEGARYAFGEARLVLVTDQELIKRGNAFWGRSQISPLHLKALAKYSREFACSDAAYTRFGHMDLKPQSGFDAVSATLFYEGQDIVAQPPRTIAILARKKNVIYFVRDQLDPADTKMPECFSEKNDGVSEDKLYYQMERCYLKGFSKSPVRDVVRKRAEEILQNLF